jgi:hypothetical protein
MAKLPRMYVESKLFPRGKLKAGLHKTAVPDPAEEDLEPEDGVQSVISKTKKALDVIKAGAAIESAGRETLVDEDRAKRAEEHDAKKFPLGVGDADTPDLPGHGRDWHGDSTPDDPSDDVDPNNEYKGVKKSNIEALKSLEAIPKFYFSSSVSPREREFLIKSGYSLDEVESGRVVITQRMRKDFNRYLTDSIQKSISGLASWVVK